MIQQTLADSMASNLPQILVSSPLWPLSSMTPLLFIVGLQTLAPTSAIERAGDQQLQTVQVREGRKNKFHIEPMVHKAEYPLFVPR